MIVKMSKNFASLIREIGDKSGNSTCKVPGHPDVRLYGLHLLIYE